MFYGTFCPRTSAVTLLIILLDLIENNQESMKTTVTMNKNINRSRLLEENFVSAVSF